ncbi:Tripartite tricarboxylate transporter family receptor [Pigmentiphaga humi]|uniref:Tripartite tricarboxylate transporter family receptor n=1 Tax=Pigmentiphaga humi TaxID=2478468 RepID=A0A3P4B8A4_9BURK|nr:tripartite tricarboxylate transporter substrate binding protein [Pigmentiphaga humi]VCU71756.1 Tripartite tricarboxylate transporter family receptor [Pigmentiphaga humi]
MHRTLTMAVRLACGVLLAGAWTAAAAQADYPARPIKLVVPYPPGGIGDTMSRDLGSRMAKRFGQPVVIENRPGASQMIGAEYVARSPADGYTLFLGSLTSLGLVAYSQKAISYDPVRDFAPVSMFFSTPLYMVVNPSVPASDVPTFIAWAKSHPGKASFGSIGIGGSLHLAGAMFNAATGTDMQHIPYKGSMPALNDLLAGRIDVMFDAGTSSLPQVRAGKLRVLGVTSAKRASGTPEISTIAEQGVGSYDASFWFGIVAPAGTPKETVQKLSATINDILRLPEIRDRYKSNGVEVEGSTPEEMAAQIRKDLPRWTEIQRQAGIVPE